MKHELYSTGDKGVPFSIVDGNGEVTLALCKVCGGAESTLAKDCPGRRIKNKPEESSDDCYNAMIKRLE